MAPEHTIVARVPARQRRAGVSYAVSADGVELPVLDVTHPALAVDLADP